MNLLLGIDFETTGVDVEKDRVIEVGMAIWSIADRKMVRLNGFLVKPDIDFTEELWAPAEAFHGISQAEVEQFGVPNVTALKTVLAWYKTADFAVAHNGLLFDRPILENWARREGLELPKRLWVDTRVDLPVPFKGKLLHIAAEHGFLNPFPHRALFDVATMLQVMDRYDFGDILKKAAEPTVLVRARVSFAEKDKAKERGYYWQSEPSEKGWFRVLKDSDVGREQREAGFPVEVVSVTRQ